MGWLTRWRRTRDMAVTAATEIEFGQPPPPLPPEAFGTGWPVSGALYGIGNGVECLTRNVALSVPAVRRGVRVITGAIAHMPMERWRGLEVLEPGMVAQPEPDRAYSTTMTLTVEDLIFFPYAWWLVLDRDAQGFPRHIRRLEPELVSVTPVPDGMGLPGEVIVTYQGKVQKQRDLIRFDGPDAGILQLGVVEILTAMRLELAARTYASPEQPTGYLKNTGQYELDAGQVTALLDDWRVGRQTRATAFLNQNVDYVNTFATPDALQLVQGREESAAQIARLLNIPPRYVGAKSGDSMTYSTQRAERQDLIDLSLTPYMDPLAQRLSMSDGNGSPRGQSVRFDTDAFLSTDPRESAEVGEILIRSQQSTPTEQRAARGLPALAAAAPTPGATGE